jgi:hypothetical protein
MVLAYNRLALEFKCVRWNTKCLVNLSATRKATFEMHAGRLKRAKMGALTCSQKTRPT